MHSVEHVCVYIYVCIVRYYRLVFLVGSTSVMNSECIGTVHVDARSHMFHIF